MLCLDIGTRRIESECFPSYCMKPAYLTLTTTSYMKIGDCPLIAHVLSEPLLTLHFGKSYKTVADSGRGIRSHSGTGGHYGIGGYSGTGAIPGSGVIPGIGPFPGSGVIPGSGHSLGRGPFQEPGHSEIGGHSGIGGHSASSVLSHKEIGCKQI